MFVDPVDRLLASGLDPSFNLGLIANQVSFSFVSNRYLFQELPNIKRIFLPEHGLFGELQDQIPVTSINDYQSFADVEWVSLYGESEDSLKVDESKLSDLDVLIIDLQDIGARYYTFLTSILYTMQSATKLQKPPVFLILDRPNPAGRSVEGTPLQSRFSSFVGVAGVLHRHGLTAAELLLYYKDQIGATNLKFCIVPFEDEFEIIDEANLIDEGESELSILQPTWVINPSPNISSPITPLVYAGQCLLEGTNLSEGRGTTRPFEIFGAPYINSKLQKQLTNELSQSDLSLRPLRFMPTFHKWANQVCNGWQLIPVGERFHSLLFSLDLIRQVQKLCSEFKYRTEAYEYRSNQLAIELLAGDQRLIDYMNGMVDRNSLLLEMKRSEAAWIQTVQPYLIYDMPLTSASTALIGV
ncbi:MAG: DUF1343 domain-containing protein [Leptonema sp. (in: Bacteria)]|nr:DUF1343 domain-containing protein [Leptonema sp. (in: bacteria)]